MEKKKLKDEMRKTLKQKIIDLSEQGKSNEQIATILKTSTSTISHYKNETRKSTKDISKKTVPAILSIQIADEKEERENFERKQIEKLCDNVDTGKTALQQYRGYISDCKDKLNNGQLEQQELGLVRKVVLLTNTYQDISFYLKLCISFNRTRGSIENCK